jgi:nucleoside-diphosphate-sugar epimerase
MHILKKLLEAGHTVRVVSRSEEKGKALKESFREHSSKVEVTLVADQLAESAYDDAVRGVDAVIHTASPFIMNAKNVKTELLEPAMTMTTNMLSAAHKSGSVRRVVLTSSLAAIVNPFEGGLFADKIYDGASWNPITEDQVEGPVLGYLGSKKLAEDLAWKFVEKNKPSFDLVTHCPSLVVGAPLQHVKSMSKLNTSSSNIYQLFDAKDIPSNQFPCLVHVDDVANAHVRSLTAAEAGGKRFILSGDRYSFQLIVDEMRKTFPELRERMCVGNPGVDENKGKTLARLDVNPARELLGIRFTNWYDTIIRDTVPALIALEENLSHA